MNKHRIKFEEPTSIRHMRGASVAHFAIIEGVPYIYVEELEGASTRRSNYILFRSGEEVPDYYQYLKSAQDPITGMSAHLYKES